MQFLKLILITTPLVFGLPSKKIEIDIGPNIKAVNNYLFGDPEPEWLKYVNGSGYFDPSLVDPKHRVVFNTLEPYYDAPGTTKFWLYTKREPNRTQIPLEDIESISTSSFDPTLPIRFLIHGWRNDETSPMIQVIKDAYLAKSDFNIIAVDWSYGASSNYYRSRHRVKPVALVVARFIEFLVENLDVNTTQIQIIGHSLGAHIAGLTGKQFERNKLAVVVGLDPALPLFSILFPFIRLHVNDADYVEVIHTAGGSLGFDLAIGDTDFYPNYGRSQPGCGWDLIGACAHSRAYEYFAESILTDTGFWSRQCRKYDEIKEEKCTPTGKIVPLGGDPIEVARAEGHFHLETNKKSPFAKGQIVGLTTLSTKLS